MKMYFLYLKESGVVLCKPVSRIESLYQMARQLQNAYEGRRTVCTGELIKGKWGIEECSPPLDKLVQYSQEIDSISIKARKRRY